MIAVRATRNGQRRGDRGQSLVEFAMVTPLLLLMLLGLVDIGRILFTYVALEEAVQEGATYGSFDPAASAIVTRVTTSSNHDEVVNATVAAPICTTDNVTVTATYDLPLITPVVSQMLGGTFTLSATFVGTNIEGTSPCLP